MIPEEIKGEFPFKSRFIEVNGSRLHYIDEGEGEVMLMLHGNPSWSFLWRSFIQHFKSQYRVIALDHMGCGFSDRPPGFTYRLKNHIDNLVAFVAKLELHQFNLVAHDWGGAIGMGFAVRHPEAVKRFVLLNTAAFASPRIPKRIAVCKLPLFGRIAIQGFNAFAKAATYMAVENRMSQRVRKGFLAPYDNFVRRQATYEFVKDIPMHRRHPSWAILKEIERKLSSLNQPMQLIWGGKDWCFDRSFLKEWQTRFPKARVDLIEEAGHYVLEDAPVRAIQTTEKFLRETH